MASTGQELGLLDLVKALGIPPWVITLFVILTIFTYLGAAYIWYSFGVVVATLAIVEDTSSKAAVRFALLPQDAELAEPLAPNKSTQPTVSVEEAEQSLASPKPITSSVHGTFRYLERTTGSRFSRMRAFGINCLHMLLLQLLGTGSAAILGHGRWIDSLSLLIILCLLSVYNTTNTHMILSQPRDVWHWKRMVWGKRWLTLMWPSFLWSAVQIAMTLAISLFTTAVLLPFLGKLLTTPAAALDAGQLLVTLIAQSAGLLLLCNSLYLLLYFPATVVLVRCQAAALLESETPIIPFDRTFGGRVGADGYLGVLEALRSFEWEAWIRTGKVYLKAVGLLSILAVAYWFGCGGLGVMAAQHRETPSG